MKLIFNKLKLMKYNLKKLLEYQITKSLDTIVNINNINTRNLNEFINTIINRNGFNINIESSNDKVKKKLVYLLENSPDFICLNKTLISITNSFISICKKDNIDTSEITEDYVNTLLISYIESSL
jgi:hypothetical protein